jgi:hypothetical protein
MSDPFDAVRNMQPTQPADTSDPFAAVRAMPAAPASASISDTPAVEPSLFNAVKGTGEAALAVGASGLKAINSAANDILPGDSKAAQADIDKDPVLNYRGGPEAQPILNALRNITAPISAIGGAIHQGISDIAGPRAADVAGDVATLLPGARGVSSLWKPSGAIEAGHPLTAAAEAENERLGSIQDRGEQLGLDLPEGGTQARHAAAAATNQPIANAAIREELNLPENSPLSPQMLQAARDQYTGPAYQAVRDIPQIPLPKDYLGDIDNFDSINKKYRPPVSGTISGEDAVDMSRYLRNKANKYFSAAKGNPDYEDIGQAHWDAAQAVEDAVKTHLDTTEQGQLGQDWDNARVYAAKTYSVQSALDGAGNVKVPALKAQLMKGKPLSGDLETLANLGAQYPEAFTTTRITQPGPGLIRRGAAALAPVAGAGVGGWLGGGYGATGGALAGQKVGEKILGQ